MVLNKVVKNKNSKTSSNENLWDRLTIKPMDLKNELKNLQLSNPEDAYPKLNQSVSTWIKNWDFSDANTKIYTHGIHQYPAMFIPQIIRKLILEFSNKGETVLDIFSGSGTTMVESMITGRKSIGIERNPLAILLSKVKTTPIDVDKLISTYESFLSKEIENSHINNHFNNIDIWFTEKTITGLSKLLYSINLIKNENIRNAFKICFSDIIRYVSTCKHSGFKMHRDSSKIDEIWTYEELLDEFHKSFRRFIIGMDQFDRVIKDKELFPTIIYGDSCKLHDQIGNQSVDLIITSPPYGDSRTTVAYGQFSRLSAQWLGLINETEKGIENIDSELLGGNINSLSLDDKVLEKSITLKTSFNNYLWEIEKTNNQKEKQKLIKRAKDVLAFYRDLDLSIKHCSTYLKPNKYFILVTGSRVVKNVKLNTDIICAELAENYDFALDGMLYRKTIPKKRMPSRVSPSNITGDTAPTMTKESIVLLRKIF